MSRATLLALGLLLGGCDPAWGVEQAPGVPTVALGADSVGGNWSPGDQGNEQAGKALQLILECSKGAVGAETTLTDTVTGTDYLHEISPEVAINLTGANYSHLLLCHLYRDNGVANNATTGMYVTDVDFHVEMKALGSVNSTGSGGSDATNGPGVPVPAARPPSAGGRGQQRHLHQRCPSHALHRGLVLGAPRRAGGRDDLPHHDLRPGVRLRLGPEPVGPERHGPGRGQLHQLPVQQRRLLDRQQHRGARTHPGHGTLPRLALWDSNGSVPAGTVLFGNGTVTQSATFKVDRVVVFGF